jgi:predicted dehydrogenase
MTISRRTFVKKSLAVAGLATTFAISGTQASGQILGANDRIRFGVVGINGRGGSHIHEFGKIPNVEIAYLIDVDSTTHSGRAAEVEKNFGNKPTCVQDIRQALEDKNLHAVSIATCNHTHSLFTIWAAQAGKDVYVEKPCSHNVFEGRKCVEAADKHKVIIKHGSQQRSSFDHPLMLAALNSGKYGKLKIAKGYCCKPRWTIGFKPEEPPPTSLAWETWLGPAPMQPFHRNLVHYNWHWFWDFGNADLGNQGVHEMDLCRWMLQKTLPNSVITFGARYVDEPETGFKDQGQTPNQTLSLYDYGDSMLLFETRGLVKNNTDWKPIVAVELYTDKGIICSTVRYTQQGGIITADFTPYDSKEPVKLGTERDEPSGKPFQNFIDCVRSRDRNKLEADIEEGHYSSALCHLGNISYRLGETASVDSIKQAFGDDPIVQKAVGDVMKNTTDALPELKDPRWTLGPKLEFHPSTEQFVGHEKANALLTRDYRAPYIVPKNV